ncbi:MAG: ribonuclease P protein component [Patescibacteria group bacterium]
MLKKSSRLSSRDVEEVLKKGISLNVSPLKGRNSPISAKFLKVPGTFRAAAVAPKSIAKSAVVRNRLRRAVYRAIAGLPTPKTPGIAVFFVRSIPNMALTPAFAREIALILEKI